MQHSNLLLLSQNTNFKFHDQLNDLVYYYCIEPIKFNFKYVSSNMTVLKYVRVINSIKVSFSGWMSTIKSKYKETEICLTISCLTLIIINVINMINKIFFNCAIQIK